MKQSKHPLRLYRTLAGMTQTQLGRKARVSAVSICRIETGRTPLTPRVAKKLGRALGVRLEMLLEQPRAE